VTKLTAQGCELCNPALEKVLWRDGFCRVVLAGERDYPGFCRVILEQHLSEMTDLSAPERIRLMEAVFATEAVLREMLAPDKINLASLGNVVPHVHWHVIPRYRDDPRFPNPIWAQSRQEAKADNRAEPRDNAPAPGTPGRGAPDVDALTRALKQRLG
jgi:diadenosine tetraphosphate (Ap4A) HIT family hydrolase